MDHTRGALEGKQRAVNTLEVPPGRHVDVEYPIPVRVRLVFERDGEQWVDGEALELTRTLVRVDTRDHRLHPRAVWVRAKDVQCREPA